MEFEDYSKVIKTVNPTYIGLKGQKISESCINLLEGMLNKNINKRFTLEQISNHEWCRKMAIVNDEIKETYQGNPDKIILELNKVEIKNINFEELSSIHSSFEIDPNENMYLGNKVKKISPFMNSINTNNISNFNNSIYLNNSDNKSNLINI
jgi:serine/threonine protein kinase